jgi:hypothetical protein
MVIRIEVIINLLQLISTYLDVCYQPADGMLLAGENCVHIIGVWVQ